MNDDHSSPGRKRRLHSPYHAAAAAAGASLTSTIFVLFDEFMQFEYARFNVFILSTV